LHQLKSLENIIQNQKSKPETEAFVILLDGMFFVNVERFFKTFER
jgi:hypothetical protein